MKRFATDNINLAAYLAVSFPYETCYSAAAGKAVFDFEDTPQIRESVMAYERGVSAPAKALMLTRTRLYHEASRVSGRGR